MRAVKLADRKARRSVELLAQYSASKKVDLMDNLMVYQMVDSLVVLKAS